MANGEVDDVRTALDWLDAEYHLPLVFAGFSFGAAVGCARPVRMRGFAARSVSERQSFRSPRPTEEPRVYALDFLRRLRASPSCFVSGARDQFGPRAKLEALVASVPEPKKLVLIEGADHFFEGRLRELREAIETWVREEVLHSA